MSAFDEIFEQTGIFTPTEDWVDSQEPIKTLGEARFSVEVDFQGVPKNVMAMVFGVDRYMDEYGRHRIHDLDLWEYKTIDVDEMGCLTKTYPFIFNKEESKCLCPDDGECSCYCHKEGAQ